MPHVIVTLLTILQSLPCCHVKCHTDDCLIASSLRPLLDGQTSLNTKDHCCRDKLTSDSDFTTHGGFWCYFDKLVLFIFVLSHTSCCFTSIFYTIETFDLDKKLEHIWLLPKKISQYCTICSLRIWLKWKELIWIRPFVPFTVFIIKFPAGCVTIIKLILTRTTNYSCRTSTSGLFGFSTCVIPK